MQMKVKRNRLLTPLFKSRPPHRWKSLSDDLSRQEAVLDAVEGHRLSCVKVYEGSALETGGRWNNWTGPACSCAPLSRLYRLSLHHGVNPKDQTTFEGVMFDAAAMRLQIPEAVHNRGWNGAVQ